LVLSAEKKLAVSPENANGGAMEKSNGQTDDDGGVQVQCVEGPDGVLTIVIRTLTNEDLERLCRIPRCAPKRVH
jgi:hypothetical protein